MTVLVLSFLESGHYSAFGNVTVTDPNPLLWPLQAQFEIEPSPQAISILGTYKRPGQAGESQFSLSLNSKTVSDESGITFLFRDDNLGTIAGLGSWVRDCYLLHGTSVDGETKLSAWLEPGENQTVSGRAFFGLATGGRITAHFTVARHEPQTAMANVVSLRRKT